MPVKKESIEIAERRNTIHGDSEARKNLNSHKKSENLQQPEVLKRQGDF